MNSSVSPSQRPRLAAGPTIVAALLLAFGASAQAESSSGSALKNTAIAGTVATWAVAALERTPFFGCLAHGDAKDDNWGGRIAAGKDAELKYESIGLERHECQLTDLGPFSLDMSPVISVGAWQADHDSLYSHNAWDFALVPMMHWRYPVSASTRLDLEFGIGPAYLSEASIGDRQKSTNFQFSDHFGLGVSSADGHWRAGFAFRHLSNLSIKTPNKAVDFKGIAIEWTP